MVLGHCFLTVNLKLCERHTISTHDISLAARPTGLPIYNYLDLAEHVSRFVYCYPPKKATIVGICFICVTFLAPRISETK